MDKVLELAHTINDGLKGLKGLQADLNPSKVGKIKEAVAELMTNHKIEAVIDWTNKEVNFFQR